VPCRLVVVKSKFVTDNVPATADIQGTSRISNSSRALAIAGVKATEGTPATADLPGTARTSNSSRALATAGVLARERTPATADIPRTFRWYTVHQQGNFGFYLRLPWMDFRNFFSFENPNTCSGWSLLVFNKLLAFNCTKTSI
jgi:hypothetical protein